MSLFAYECRKRNSPKMRLVCFSFRIESIFSNYFTRSISEGLEFRKVYVRNDLKIAILELATSNRSISQSNNQERNANFMIVTFVRCHSSSKWKCERSEPRIFRWSCRRDRFSSKYIIDKNDMWKSLFFAWPLSLMTPPK